jgi:hypothetical protein
VENGEWQLGCSLVVLAIPLAPIVLIAAILLNVSAATPSLSWALTPSAVNATLALSLSPLTAYNLAKNAPFNFSIAILDNQYASIVDFPISSTARIALS